MGPPISEYASVRRVLEDALSMMARERRVESVLPADSFGRVSADEVRSPADIPARTVSRMDGFAVRSANTEAATETRPTRLQIAGEVPLGATPAAKAKAGEAWRVSTGSFIPDGTDAVLPVEDVWARGGRIVVMRPIERSTNLYPAGEDIRKGAVLMPKGARFRAQDVALAITLRVRSLNVYGRPRVAVLATGSELTNSAYGEEGKIPNSHVPFFLSLAGAVGCDAVDMGIARDRRGEIASKLGKSLRLADIVLTTGGTSAGKFDLLDEAIRRLEPSVIHHGIRMDRGRVAGLAVIRRKPVVMMPGPIQGALNAFILLALPLIQRASGGIDELPRVRAKLSRRWEARKRFPNFTKVLYLRLVSGRSGIVAEPLVGETESVSLLRRSNAVTIVPEEVRSMEAGHDVEAILLPGFSSVA
ncbi:MAG: molybdopterin molybdotransferase MoeA [Nitrososphaerota archaeon]|nr:molybdopterin molybdotransferase MoeA [Nitrososphaerota archaeon]